MTHIKPIAWGWFDSGQVGIIIIYDSITRQYKSYIGCSKPGNLEFEDVENIKLWGGRFPLESACIALNIKEKDLENYVNPVAGNYKVAGLHP